MLWLPGVQPQKARVYSHDDKCKQFMVVESTHGSTMGLLEDGANTMEVWKSGYEV
jgi:hypothetical protein